MAQQASPPKIQFKQLIRSLVLEQSLWLGPATFYFFYSILVLGQSQAAIIPHLIIIFSFALCFTATRAVAPNQLRILANVLHGTALAVLVAFYIACLVGFTYWGRIPTLSMIQPYVNHFDDLLETQNISSNFFVSSILIYLAGFIVLCAYLTKRSDERYFSILTRIVFFIAGIIFAFFSYINISNAKYSSQQEPITLMINGTTLVNSTPRINTDKIARIASENYAAGENRPNRNVILIVGDALRPSRMSLFGASRQTTPKLDKLAESEDLAYKGTINTACAESFCGLVSLSRSSYAHTVSKFDLTMAEVLQQHGYQHKLVLGGDHTNFYGLREWLGKSDHYWDGTYSGIYTNDDRGVIDHLQTLSPNEEIPEVLQIHLMSTHALGTREKSSQQWAPVHNYYRSHGFSKTASQRNLEMINYYDNGVLQFDDKVSKILEILREKNYLKDALVIITGDHGEMLGEHSRYAHGNGVYQPVLEVPLIILRFGHKGPTYISDQKAAHIDIGPTILSELNLPIPQRWLGSSLDKLAQRQILFFEHHNEFGLTDFSIPEKRWKYWINRDTGEEFAFELNSDPGELRNRSLFIPHSLRTKWRDALKDSLSAKPII